MKCYIKLLIISDQIISIYQDWEYVLFAFWDFLDFLDKMNCQILLWMIFHFLTLLLKLNISKSKTDIYRRGNKEINYVRLIFWKIILKQPTLTYILVNIYFSVKKFKPLSYTKAREILLSALRTVGYDESLYDLHSLRSGGVSAAAKNNV